MLLFKNLVWAEFGMLYGIQVNYLPQRRETEA
jgi:hypothetical protein